MRLALDNFGAGNSPLNYLLQFPLDVVKIDRALIARPSREILFTVVDQESRYKAKNVIDTVVYRFGDLSSAWLQTGVRAAGLGFHGAIALGVGASLGWGAVAALLGRRYERIRKTLAR